MDAAGLLGPATYGNPRHRGDRLGSDGAPPGRGRDRGGVPGRSVRLSAGRRDAVAPAVAPAGVDGGQKDGQDAAGLPTGDIHFIIIGNDDGIWQFELGEMTYCTYNFALQSNLKPNIMIQGR